MLSCYEGFLLLESDEDYRTAGFRIARFQPGLEYCVNGTGHFKIPVGRHFEFVVGEEDVALLVEKGEYEIAI